MIIQSVGIYYFIKINTNWLICRRLGDFDEAIATSKREKVSPLCVIIS